MDQKSPDFQWALPNRRGMEFPEITTSYKCIGNEGSKTSFASISQAFSDESFSFPNRQ